MIVSQSYPHLDETEPFTRFTRCRCHCRVAPAIALRIAFPPAPTVPAGFAPGRRPIIHADRGRCRFPPGALRFCVGAGYLSPTWRTHKHNQYYSDTNQIMRRFFNIVTTQCQTKLQRFWCYDTPFVHYTDFCLQNCVFK